MLFSYKIICYVDLLGYRQCQPHAFNKLTYLLSYRLLTVDLKLVP